MESGAVEIYTKLCQLVEVVSCDKNFNKIIISNVVLVEHLRFSL